MGAESAAGRIVKLVPSEPVASLGALTEIRTPAGESAALAVLSHDPPNDLVIAAVRYLAKIGNAEVSKILRKLVRDEDPQLRIIANLVSRALEAERKRDAGERILAARAVKLAHKLQVLAMVRNIVPHRSVAGASTLAEFRKTYYSAFEELTALA